MASRRAVAGRTRADKAMDQARKQLFEEGISSSRYYVDPIRPGVEDLMDQIVAGVRSAFTYAGARSVSEFWDRAVVGVTVCHTPEALTSPADVSSRMRTQPVEQQSRSPARTLPTQTKLSTGSRLRRREWRHQDR